MVQSLGLGAFTAVAQVQFLVGELQATGSIPGRRTTILQATWQKKKNIIEGLRQRNIQTYGESL